MKTKKNPAVWLVFAAALGTCANVCAGLTTVESPVKFKPNGSIIAAKSESGFVIADSGQAKAVIVTGEKPPEHIAYAAAELKKYLAEMTGAELPVVEKRKAGTNNILVGGDYKASNKEEVAVFFSQAGLEITGEGTRGKVYAAYEFLRLLGCEFWEPGGHHTIGGIPDYNTIPKIPTLKIKKSAKLVQAPAFLYRQAWGPQSRGEACSWAARVGQNIFDTGARTAAKYGGAATIDAGEVLTYRFMKPDQYFDAHPEWYALRDGKRVKDHLCLTNLEMRKQLLTEIREFIAKNPETPTVSLGTPDNDKYCQCEACRELIAKHNCAGYVVEFANWVAEAMEKDYPDIGYFVLSYWVTENPPKNITAHKNVYCRCAQGRNHSVSLRHPGNAGTLNRIQGWNKVMPGRLMVWDYYAVFVNFAIPAPEGSLMAENFRVYAENGVFGVTAQMAWGDFGDFVALNSFLLSRLTWDPTLDDKALVKGWIKGTCGPAAEYVQTYWNMRNVSRDKYIGKYFAGMYGFAPAIWWSAEDAIEAYGLYKKALAATAKPEDIRFRLEVERLFAGNLIEMICRWRDTKFVKKYPETAAKMGYADMFPKTREELVEEVAELTTRHGHCWNEGWKDFKRVVEEWRTGKW